MADIDIVPKRRTGSWLWILLVVVVIALLWLAFGRSATTQIGLMRDQGVAPTGVAVVAGMDPA